MTYKKYLKNIWAGEFIFALQEKQIHSFWNVFKVRMKKSTVSECFGISIQIEAAIHCLINLRNGYGENPN